MKMYDTTSSLIARYGYDTATSTMQLDFHNGGLYRYHEVPLAVFTEFLRARSKGKFFLQNIKGPYKYEKVSA